MTPRKDRGQGRSSTPPDTTPVESTSAYTVDQSFTLQAIMEMQKTLGSLTSKIESLDKSVTQMAKDVSNHGKWVFAANAILVLFLAGFGWLMNAVWDVVKVKLGF